MGTGSGCGKTREGWVPDRSAVRRGGVTTGGWRWAQGQAKTCQMVSSSRNSSVVPCVYILASKKHGILYVGVTSNIARRVWQHKNRLVGGFTKKYGVHRLVWYETHPTMEGAITREKQMKEWNRDWKVQLIEEVNRAWRDLYREVL